MSDFEQKSILERTGKAIKARHRLMKCRPVWCISICEIEVEDDAHLLWLGRLY